MGNQALRQPNNPLVIIFICIILPRGFNSFFEEMEVTVACQILWTYHVAIKPPELLHRGKGTNLFDNSVHNSVSCWDSQRFSWSTRKCSCTGGDALPVRDNSLPLVTALILVPFCFFLSQYLSVCCFLHSDHGPHCHHLSKHQTCCSSSCHYYRHCLTSAFPTGYKLSFHRTFCLRQRTPIFMSEKLKSILKWTKIDYLPFCKAPLSIYFIQRSPHLLLPLRYFTTL